MEGRVLAGRFRLVEILGRGGMGSVWRARHLELDTDVAVKLMDPNLTTNEEGLARFRREAQAAASLKSPHVVQVFDYGIDGDTPYIAMELLQGESLAKRIERLRRLPIKTTAALLSQVARALGKAHDAGIVHRDLKPENIFLVTDDDSEIAKVLDFGIAKQTGADKLMPGALQTQTGAMLGTPYYMSPEQAAGKRNIDHRTDIWSFGVIACECLTGRRLFDSDSLGGLVLAICTEPIPPSSELGPLPPGFEEWLSRCVNRDCQARFQAIREAAAALEAIARLSSDGLSASSTASAVQPAVQAITATAQLQAFSGLESGTQAGPTSRTVSGASSSNRARLLGVGAVAGICAIGGLLFFWWTRAATMTTSPVLSAVPTESMDPNRILPPSAAMTAPASSATAAPIAIPVTAPPVAVAAPPAAVTPSPIAISAAPAKPRSDKRQPETKPKASASPSRSSPRPAVDLAF